jgi:hypothetical protein
VRNKGYKCLSGSYGNGIFHSPIQGRRRTGKKSLRRIPVALSSRDCRNHHLYRKPAGTYLHKRYIDNADSTGKRREIQQELRKGNAFSRIPNDNEMFALYICSIHDFMPPRSLFFDDTEKITEK